jgi:NAD-dependent SIR2 family protein deacetylase
MISRKEFVPSIYTGYGHSHFCCCATNKTQNIDGLETIAGVNPERLVECHGHFRSSSCIDCGSIHNADDCKSSMLVLGEAPTCSTCGGLVKPNIVFFGEVMPNRFSQLVHIDVASCDLVVVLGTSLLVDPVASIPNWVKSDVHRLLINRDVVGSFNLGKPTDVFLEGDCDER